MCVLDPDPVAASEARRFVADTFAQWHLTDDLDTAALLTSELVTNGVLHARTPLEVGLTSDERGLLVEVHDSDPRPPTPRGHRANLLADIEEVLLRPDAATINDERQALLAVGPAGGTGAGPGLPPGQGLPPAWGGAPGEEGKAGGVPPR